MLAKIELSTELTEIPEPIAVTNCRTPGGAGLPYSASGQFPIRVRY